VGFFQYLAPSTTFLLAVLVYGEPLTPAWAVAFALIWAALAVFTFDGLQTRARLRARAPQ
jgi:chloramphenicol-sensitive protein RarD